MISKNFNSAINLPQKVMNIPPNYPIVDEFCEKVKNFDFEKFGISSYIQSPQEIDMVGKYTIIYEINDGSGSITVEKLIIRA